MRRVHFFVNDAKPDAKRGLGGLESLAREAGLEPVGADRAEAVAAVGGDGTILRAVHRFPALPILGLNAGGLGYLASVERKDFAAALVQLAAGRYRISERTLLAGAGFTALNDVVVVRERSGHAADFELAVDGRPVTRYTADGLIFATPTGSTAYSLAAGGPVLMSDSGSFVVTPMSPHALGVRPMVVGDGARFEVAARSRTEGDEAKIEVYADGVFVRTLAADEKLEFGRAARGAAMIELEGYDPYAVLARKLGWSGSNVK